MEPTADFVARMRARIIAKLRERGCPEGDLDARAAAILANGLRMTLAGITMPHSLKTLPSDRLTARIEAEVFKHGKLVYDRQRLRVTWAGRHDEPLYRRQMQQFEAVHDTIKRTIDALYAERARRDRRKLLQTYLAEEMSLPKREALRIEAESIDEVAEIAVTEGSSMVFGTTEDRGSILALPLDEYDEDDPQELVNPRYVVTSYGRVIPWTERHEVREWALSHQGDELLLNIARRSARTLVDLFTICCGAGRHIDDRYALKTKVYLLAKQTANPALMPVITQVHADVKQICREIYGEKAATVHFEAALAMLDYGEPLDLVLEDAVPDQP